MASWFISAALLMTIVWEPVSTGTMIVCLFVINNKWVSTCCREMIQFPTPHKHP